jgi:hypothetical protein
MSFFGRTVITLAVVAGILHVFRRDVARIVGVLRKPTENFLRDVKKEIDTGATPGALAARSQSTTTITTSAEKAAAAASAAEQVKGGAEASAGADAQKPEEKKLQ